MTAPSESVPQRPAGPRQRRKPASRWLMVLGVLLLVFGLGSLAWIGWQYYGTNIVSNQAMNEEVNDLLDEWKGDDAAVEGSATGEAERAEAEDWSSIEPGQAIALLRIPAFGSDYVKPIIAGTEDPQLERGVGWYTMTQHPGEIGNFAVAGHRVTHGEPFARLLELNVGDEIIVETGAKIYHYELYVAPRDLTLDANEGGWVLEAAPAADPAKRGKKPTEAIITLTTCTDLFAAQARSIGFGRLVQVETK